MDFLCPFTPCFFVLHRLVADEGKMSEDCLAVPLEVLDGLVAIIDLLDFRVVPGIEPDPVSREGFRTEAVQKLGHLIEPDLADPLEKSLRILHAVLGLGLLDDQQDGRL